MIRVSILYPNEQGAWFDLGYYLDTHLPMALEKLGSAVKGVSVDHGLSAGSQGPRPPFFAICHFVAESPEAYQEALEPHREALGRDIENYTNVQPLIQVSEIRLSR
ncbi:MAG: EthD family reductase [Oleiphilaceae bacterium]|nr:EthD family reductase [Oleiphilaceae bacterium]